MGVLGCMGVDDKLFILLSKGQQIICRLSQEATALVSLIANRWKNASYLEAQIRNSREEQAT